MTYPPMILRDLLYACCYEIGLWFRERNPSLRFKPQWFVLMMDYCFPYWVENKTAQTMDDVDSQIQELHKKWDRWDISESNQPIVIEKLSQVDGLPELRITAPWYRDDTD
jgi:hypothetical protein